MESKL